MSEPLSPDLRDLLALHLLPGLGCRLTAALLHRFGSAAAVLHATPTQLQEVPHIGTKLAHDIHRAIGQIDVEAELDLMARQGVRLLERAKGDFPKPLENIPDSPHLLYVRGTLQPTDANAVAIVGSRVCTRYGQRIAERLAGDLVRAGFTVVSGLARGIDGLAHRGALKAGGRTFAVLAGGLSKIYPPEHAELAREVEVAGALLTKSAMRMEPMAGMFPARNRLISGLSRAVVVIEAAEKSGALITARHAAEQGRAVFAVPGPLDSPSSAGTHYLVRQGATLIRGVDDVLEELDGVKEHARPTPAPPPPDMEPIERCLWEFLQDHPRHIDEMAQHLALPVPQITGALLTLEMKKLVRRLPGNQYERR
jgi:DNA processing protein